jgi:hypothetical protein
MNKPLLALAGLIAAGGTAVGVYVAIPGGGEEEVVQQGATVTPDTSATPTAGVTLTPHQPHRQRRQDAITQPAYQEAMSFRIPLPGPRLSSLKTPTLPSSFSHHP